MPKGLHVSGDGSPPLRFQTLGPLQVTRGDDALPLGPPLQRTLLAALLVESPHTVQVPVLLDRIWGDDPPETAEKSVQKYVSSLRRVLGPDRIIWNSGYRLVSEPEEVDDRRLERAFTEFGSDEHDPEQRLVLLEEGLALWRGEPFADLPEPLFLEPVRVRLGEVRLALIEERLSSLLDLGKYDQVSTETGELVDLYPFRERLWRLRMSALVGVGRQAEALAEFIRLRHILGDQLGLEPSPETVALEERILLQDPALAPALKVAGNLPSRTSSILGRESVLDHLEGILEGTRLLTIVGTAGVGKTTVALELGGRVADSYPHGVWLVGLAPIGDPLRISGVAAEALGLPESPGATPEDALGEHLAHRRCLIVFDNCEHVIDGASNLISRLLARAPELRVLVTSRQPLGVAGERVFGLEALEFPNEATPAPLALAYPSVKLLLARSEEAGARFLDVEGSARDLAEIARWLDGIPLAIELAAARLRINSPAELSRRLRDRISLLDLGRRDAPDRQHTIEAAIDWSFQLLDPAEQELLARLSVFRGGFTVDAVQGVCGSDSLDVEPLLTTLVDRSLVSVQPQAGGTNRYYLLHVIRLFAQFRLEDEELATTADRHAAYFADRISDIGVEGISPRSGVTFDVSADYENIRVALAHFFDSTDLESGLRLVAALGGFWISSGRMLQGRSWIERFLEAAPDGPPGLRAGAYLALGQVLQPASTELALDACELALVEARAAGDRRLLARSWRNLGYVHAVRGDRDIAASLTTQALEIFVELDDKWGIGQCLSALGTTFPATPSGLEHYRGAIAAYRETGAQPDLGSTLFFMAYRSLIPMGRFEEARLALYESLDIASRFQLHHGILHATTGMGQLARLEGNIAEARGLLGKCLEGMRIAGDRRCTVRICTALARIAIAEGDEPLSWSYLTEGVGVASDEDPGLSSDLHELIDVLALAALTAADVETAARWFGAAEAIRVELGALRAPPDEIDISGARHRVEESIGPELARSLFEEGSHLTLDQIAEEVRRDRFSSAAARS